MTSFSSQHVKSLIHYSLFLLYFTADVNDNVRLAVPKPCPFVDDPPPPRFYSYLILSVVAATFVFRSCLSLIEANLLTSDDQVFRLFCFFCRVYSACVLALFHLLFKFPLPTPFEP